METEDGIFEDPPTSMLWVTARIPQDAKVYGLVYQSPRVVVDQYIGYRTDHLAPEWTRRTTQTFEFQQLRVAFADIFLRLAFNRWNMHAQGWLYHMHLWAKSALVRSFIRTNCHVLTLHYIDQHLGFASWQSPHIPTPHTSSAAHHLQYPCT